MHPYDLQTCNICTESPAASNSERTSQFCQYLILQPEHSENVRDCFRTAQSTPLGNKQLQDSSPTTGHRKTRRKMSCLSNSRYKYLQINPAFTRLVLQPVADGGVVLTAESRSGRLCSPLEPCPGTSDQRWVDRQTDRLIPRHL